MWIIFRVCEQNVYWIICIILMRLIGGCFCEKGITPQWHSLMVLYTGPLLAHSSILAWKWCVRPFFFFTLNSFLCLSHGTAPILVRTRWLYVKSNQLPMKPLLIFYHLQIWITSGSSLKYSKLCLSWSYFVIYKEFNLGKVGCDWFYSHWL